MYFINPRLAADVFDGEYIIANLDTGLYYSVQGMAVSLLNALPFQDHNQVIQLLADAFPEKGAVIEQELNSIVKELLQDEIIQQGEDSVSVTPLACIPPSEYTPSLFNRYADMQDLLMLDPIHDVDEEGWMVQNDDTKK